MKKSYFSMALCIIDDSIVDVIVDELAFRCFSSFQVLLLFLQQ